MHRLCLTYRITVLLLGLLVCSITLANSPGSDVTLQLHNSTGIELRAWRINGQAQRQLRFPPLQAGEHRLEVRMHYEIPGWRRSGGFGESHWRTCIMQLPPVSLQAGNHYHIRARRLGRDPQLWLEDATGKQLQRASIRSCGPGL